MAQKQSNALGFEVIKQYPGPQQVQRAVKVNVPGKHFPQRRSHHRRRHRQECRRSRRRRRRRHRRRRRRRSVWQR